MMRDYGYQGTADELVNRIVALIPEHPEILSMKDPWGLFKVAGFKCDDLQPSAFQASWALTEARIQWAKRATCRKAGLEVKP